MKIDIIIKDVSVEIAQQIFALVGGGTKIEQVTDTKTETIKTDAHLPFDCEWCGRKFKSQNSVNSHLKYCKDKPANKAKAKPEEVKPEPEAKLVADKPAVKKPAEKKKHTRRAVVVKPPKKKETKPAFVAPSDTELSRTVASLVINNGHDITSTASVVHHIYEGLKSKHGVSEKLTQYAQKLDKLVTERLIKIESFLGAGQCMGMSLPDGYQIAVFADHGSLKLATLMEVL